MLIFIQNSDPRHLSLMTEALTHRGDDARGTADLLELRHLAVSSRPADAVFLELSAEAVAWSREYAKTNPGCRFVFFTPRAAMDAAMTAHPDLSILPSPGTALAARCLISSSPEADPACTLGDYQLIEIQALDGRTHIFRAMQRSIQRPVVLRLLNQENELDESAYEAFLEDARAKAAVTHDRVGTVFQALEDRGAIFYTAESLEGPTLRELAADGHKLPPRQVLEIARTVASALSHLASRNVNCMPIELRHIHLSGPQLTPRLANPATLGQAAPGRLGAILQNTLALLIPLVDAAASHADEVQQWLKEFEARPAGSVDPNEVIGELRQEIARTENRAQETPAAGLSGSKSSRGYVTMVASISAVVVIGALLLNYANKTPPQRAVGDIETFVAFAGGDLQHPERGAISLSPFNIDKYEVTIRQYAEFLEDNAAAPAAHDHPAQASQRAEKKDHRPRDWATYYPIAQIGGEFEARKLTLDCPVFNVDWWDAQAYARWRNRRLPTQDEWELAARGASWRKYPWGDDWSPAKTNCADKPAPLEGHQAWSPVDLPQGDRTPENVAGLAGNVSEWTESEAVHPEDPSRTIPVVKGGSFVTKAETDAGKRVNVLSRNEQKLWLGFRTATTLSQP